MDKLTAMATFVKVVDAGSFTRAVDALGLPKARVSQRVSDLEKHLGVRLLNRTTRALSLTHDGSAYFDKCQVLLQQIDELEATLRGGTATPIYRLRVDSLDHHRPMGDRSKAARLPGALPEDPAAAE